MCVSVCVCLFVEGGGGGRNTTTITSTTTTNISAFHSCIHLPANTFIDLFIGYLSKCMTT